MTENETEEKKPNEKLLKVDRSDALITSDHPLADLFHKVFIACWTPSASPDPDGWK